ncbi:MAG: alpha/beta fold hydrolase [Hyphomicrobiales bacterium]|nr:alpha/beta fold hydrolase [Hyphomicrobiales bacterium]
MSDAVATSTLARMVPGARVRALAAGGTILHCVEAGQGPPLVLLAGWPQSVHCWRHVMAPLARHHRVIAIDPPGLGDSAKPSPAYDVAAVAEIMAAALDALALDRCDLVGFDIGMWIAYPLALRHPHRLRTLTLMDARIPGLVPWPPFNPRGAVLSWHFAFNMLPDLPEILVDGRERELLRWLFASRTPTPGVFTDADLDEYARVYRGKAAIASAVGYYRAIPESIAQVELLRRGPKVAMPVLAVAAAAGVGTPMIDAVRSVADDMRGVVIESCGHYIPEEAPERLLRELEAFLTATSL